MPLNIARRRSCRAPAPPAKTQRVGAALPDVYSVGLPCCPSGVMGDWSDDEIAAKVDDITAALVFCGKAAIERDDKAWLDRHRWFRDACARLFADQLVVLLDG